MALTIKKVAKLLRRGEPGRHSDNGGADGVKGLRLVVAEKNAAHWELRYQLGGRTRWMGLGSARTFSLQEVRQRAKKVRQQLKDKIDPLEARQAERTEQKLGASKKLTFKEAAQQYFDQHEAKWASPNASSWARAHRPPSGSQPASARSAAYSSQQRSSAPAHWAQSLV